MCYVIAIKTMYHSTCFMNRSIQYPTDMRENMNEEELMKESIKLSTLLIKKKSQIATLKFVAYNFYLDVFQKYNK